MDPLILRQDVSFLSGPGGSGKTRLVLAMLGALAKGGYVFGHPDLDVSAAGRGILITGGEERPQTLKWMAPDIDCDVIMANGSWTDADGNLSDDAHAHLEICLARKYSLVVLDSISNLYHGNENDRGQVNAFINDLRAYAYQGLSILIIGHTSRQNDRWSGSTGWQTGPRSHISILPDENDPDVKVITLEKANRAKAGQDWRVTNIQPDGSFGPWRMAHSEADVSDDPMPRHITRLVQFLRAQGVPQSFCGEPHPVPKSRILKALRVGDGFADNIFQAAADQSALKFFPPVAGTRAPYRWLLPSPEEEAEEEQDEFPF